MIIRGKNIVIVGLQPWDTEIGSNCKNIALEFSKHNKVLYVNSPMDRITSLLRKDDHAVKKRLDILKTKTKNIELVHPNLWIFYPDVIIESINWIKINFVFDILNKLNNKKLAGAILRAVEKLGFEEFILFNDNDIFRSFYLKEYLKPSLSIYYSRDYLLAVEYWRYHGSRLEPVLMSKSDICVANSAYLAAICKKYNTNSYDIGQGCEVDMFLDADKQPMPTDMTGISQPIIGYVGALQSLRLDIEILMHLAVERPEWKIVLVGPEDEDFKNSDLHRLENVHFIGSKNPSELPSFINSFTICVNPQLLNEVTIGNYPRKVDEYLAVGKPVVATKTESMDLFSGYVYLADTKEQYVDFIDLALNEDNSELTRSRREFASGHTWEASVQKIYDAVSKLWGIACS
ncbi:glycosyltransferase [Pedobacter psychroterrae]|uniref:Glycosyltransferase family 1 protein n=1 Tax=Pedobacter psychroterrae TaxID=2530453 RepID=A0A4R0NPN5_9SPHI|nr:glycosyltransferase [Pedobacter psychroterrae]TCD01693.1 glycosyltransferase family 1 protein [Pedobacter psychroterrae]